MPIFNITIPDSSPMIRYDGLWFDTPKSDGQWQQYQNQTFHQTNSTNATATLSFNGSAVYIYGSRRPGYGHYSVALDTSSPLVVSASAPTDRFNTVLFSATSLDTSMEHQVAFTNADATSQGLSVDIDYIIVTAGDGNKQTASQDTFLDDSDTRILYSSGWNLAGGNPNYTDSTAHLTYTQGALATLTFEGTAIALYATVNNDHGLFSVSIDGSTPTAFNGFAPEARFRMLLYYVNGLPSGQHSLSIENVSPPGNGRTNGLELDMVQISSWPDSALASQNAPRPSANIAPNLHSPSTQSLPTNAISTSTPASLASHTPTAIIAGTAIAAAVGTAACAIALFLWYRRQHHRKGARDEQEERSGSHNYSQATFPSASSSSHLEADGVPSTELRTPSSSVVLSIEPRSTVSDFSVSPLMQTAKPSPPSPSGVAEKGGGIWRGVMSRTGSRRVMAWAVGSASNTSGLRFDSEADTAPPPYV